MIENFNMATSIEMTDYMNTIPTKAKEIGCDYNLLDKIISFEDESDLARIHKVLEHCLWVGFCDGKGWK